MKNDNYYMENDFPTDDSGPELIPLLSTEEEEEMINTKLPDSLPVLPLRNTVLFPGVVIPITIGRDKSIKLIKMAKKQGIEIGAVAQKDPKIEDPTFEELENVGTLARIIRVFRMPDGNTTVIIQGIKRFRLVAELTREPYMTATIERFEEKKFIKNKEFNALIDSVRDLAQKIIDLNPNIPTEAGFALKNIDSPRFLVNFISANMDADPTLKQSILNLDNLPDRAHKVLGHLTNELQMLELKNEIQSKARFDIDRQQREFFLSQQLKQIHEELGHTSPDKEIENMRDKGAKMKWPENVAETFNKELERLSRINNMSPEFSVGLNYCQTLLDLPWGVFTKDNLNQKRAEECLNEDHFGMEKVKQRILEYLAVLKLKGDMKSPILCLYGPPGVGKTSLGKSIARSMGRKYVRMSLGGLHDEAEIRGHRKTYIGAMPGRVMQSLKKAKSANPVFILDEIDKVGRDYRGDVSSALLEVLDPEQNGAFYDNYLETEFDLSKVMFIATANSLDSIQPALLDRMEIIEITGYTLEEKVEIAKKYLLPKQREAHGLKAANFKVSDETLVKMIDEYTRESGVRGLEKKLASLARARAREVVAGNKTTQVIKPEQLLSYLGPERSEKEKIESNQIAGVVCGLAWTQAGGEILYVEASLVKGRGGLKLTGQLGDVMKESAYTALTYIQAHAKNLHINPEIFKHWDVHIHVPAGAVPKDGPSAGVTMLTSLASVFTQKRVKPNLAMTGEITLRGKVLPVGGIKEKILAARRAGVKEIILCQENKKDVDDIGAQYTEGLQFHYVTRMDEVLSFALMGEKVNDPLDLTVFFPKKRIGFFGQEDDEKQQ